MSSRSLDVSVIICAYTMKRWEYLVAAVQSAQRQTLPPREIILVVDHNPELLARVRQHLTGVVVIENQEPTGISGARNSGVVHAKGSILAFLDDDARAAPDWLERMVRGYDNPNVVGVGGALEPLWLGGQPKWFPEEFNWVVGCTYRGLPEQPTFVRNLIGANMSLRRDVFEVGGGFANGIGRLGTIPVGCEETELCIRVRQKRPEWAFLYDPSVRAFHNVPAIRVKWAYFQARCYAEGISKALVSRAVGPQDGLAAEWTYTLRTLPTGVIRNLVGAVRHREPAGVARAGVIVAGLAITTAGYLRGIASLKLDGVKPAKPRMLFSNRTTS